MMSSSALTNAHAALDNMFVLATEKSYPSQVSRDYYTLHRMILDAYGDQTCSVCDRTPLDLKNAAT